MQQPEQQILQQLPDKFESVRPVPGGKNATVFLAEHRILRIPLFLKVYPLPKDKEEVLLLEPQLLGQLTASRHVATIYDAELIGGEQLLLAMEQLGGGSFQDEIDRCHDSKSWPTLHGILDAVRDAAFGLQELHERGFVHRDVKPANLMFRVQPAGRVGVVTDLGLVGRLQEEGRAARSMHAKAYRPPEAFTVGTYSRSSDVYQIGLVLYQMLGGRFLYPPEDISEDDLMEFILGQKMLDFSSLAPVITGRIRAFLRQCICEEAERLPDVPTFLLELANLRASVHDWTWRQTGTKHVYEFCDKQLTRRLEVETAGPTTLTVYESRSEKPPRQKGKAIALRTKSWTTQRDFTIWLT